MGENEIVMETKKHGYGFKTVRHWKKGEIMCFQKQTFYNGIELNRGQTEIKVYYEQYGKEKTKRGVFIGFHADGISDKVGIEQKKQKCYIPLHIITGVEEIPKK